DPTSTSATSAGGAAEPAGFTAGGSAGGTIIIGDGSTPTAPEAAPLWALVLAKGGLSFFVAFCVGYALRTFLKGTMLVVGVVERDRGQHGELVLGRLDERGRRAPRAVHGVLRRLARRRARDARRPRRARRRAVDVDARRRRRRPSVHGELRRWRLAGPPSDRLRRCSGTGC
ncbi:MAG: hypothetical protein VX113_00135, partial [Pseudomonadota bacterium]|nr:hypothetical protein [Pseudomonadota bacterium]